MTTPISCKSLDVRIDFNSVGLDIRKAAKEGRLTFVTKLLWAGCSRFDRSLALRVAVEQNRFQVVEAFSEEERIRDALINSARIGDLKQITTLLKQSSPLDQGAALITAAHKGKVAAVKLLLSAGSCPKDYKSQALKFAVRTQNNDLVNSFSEIERGKLLVNSKLGLNVNDVRFLLEVGCPLRDRYTALQTTAEKMLSGKKNRALSY